jgi:hypothetical protein
MRGLIDKVWENQDRKGRNYLVVEIAGDRYSLWNGDLMDQIEEGMVVEYEWKQSGKYKNITSLEADSAFSATARANKRDRDMVRMSCLKSAASLLAGSELEPDQRGDLTLQLAKQFEEYISSPGD